MLDSIDTIVNTILQQDDKVDIDFNTVDPGSVAVYKMPHTFDSEDVDSNPVKREGSITGVATAKGQEVTNAEFTYPMFTLGGDELPRKVVIRQEHDSKIYEVTDTGFNSLNQYASRFTVNANGAIKSEYGQWQVKK